jgi:hypothetical protein
MGPKITFTEMRSKDNPMVQEAAAPLVWHEKKHSKMAPLQTSQLFREVMIVGRQGQRLLP